MIKKYIILFAAALLGCSALHAQDPGGQFGAVTYCLPSTTLSFEVEAVCEIYHAGPYAAHAAKYLGLDVRRNDAMTFSIGDVKMVPLLEADQSARYFLDTQNAALNASFLKMTAQGLVSVGDAAYGNASAWKFPVDTLKKVSGIPQKPTASKSSEKKAAEAAAAIIRLREKRMQIVTGDTDATYSGEAMGAAVRELTRMENEYLQLFTGYSEYQTQKLVFDVVPQKDRSSQMYVAFRLSETDGLLSAESASGKPIVLEITPEPIAVPDTGVQKGKPAKDVVYVTYRIPAICNVRLSDGSRTLIQGRVPIFQFGTDSTMPANLTVK